jgi:hypothetical protein
MVVMWPPPPRGKVCKVFGTETLGLDLRLRSDVQSRKFKGFWNDKPQSIQNKPLPSDDFGRIFVSLFVEVFHRFFVYFTGRVKR